jgi:uncharacterized protein (UPF0335 family)
MVNTGGIAGDSLRSLIARIESLEDDRKVVTTDIKEVYDEAKALGFDPKIMRKVVTIRKLDSEKRQEQADLLDIYLHALEGIPD